MKNHLKNSGFTLAEMMISVVIILLVLLMVTSVYSISQKTMRQANGKAELIQNSRVALDIISREVRQAKKIVTELPTTELNAPHEIEFEDGHDTSEIKYIHYVLSGNQLLRQVVVYYFDTNPEMYVRYNDVDAFGEPERTVLEEKVIGEYFDNIYFYGNGNINISMYMKKNGYEINNNALINPRNI